MSADAYVDTCFVMASLWHRICSGQAEILTIGTVESADSQHNLLRYLVDSAIESSSICPHLVATTLLYMSSAASSQTPGDCWWPIIVGASVG